MDTIDEGKSNRHVAVTSMNAQKKLRIIIFNEENKISIFA